MFEIWACTEWYASGMRLLTGGWVWVLAAAQPVEGTAGDIAALPAGATLEMSAVLGKGFDMSKAASASDILIFATGSGIRCAERVINRSTQPPTHPH